MVRGVDAAVWHEVPWCAKQALVGKGLEWNWQRHQPLLPSPPEMLKLQSLPPEMQLMARVLRANAKAYNSCPVVQLCVYIMLRLKWSKACNPCHLACMCHQSVAQGACVGVQAPSVPD